MTHHDVKRIMESSDLIYGILCGEGKFVLRQYERPRFIPVAALILV